MQKEAESAFCNRPLSRVGESAFDHTSSPEVAFGKIWAQMSIHLGLVGAEKTSSKQLIFRPFEPMINQKHEREFASNAKKVLNSKLA